MGISKQKKFLVSYFLIGCSQELEPKIIQKKLPALEMKPQINENLLKMFLHNITNY